MAQDVQQWESLLEIDVTSEPAWVFIENSGLFIESICDSKHITIDGIHHRIGCPDT
jgi:hypothetical protein